MNEEAMMLGQISLFEGGGEGWWLKGRDQKGHDSECILMGSPSGQSFGRDFPKTTHTFHGTIDNFLCEIKCRCKCSFLGLDFGEVVLKLLKIIR